MNKSPDQKLVIVLPLHKQFEQLSGGEIISIKQLNNILKAHTVCLVSSENMATDKYRECLADCDITVEIFERQFFESVKSYNRLCLSKAFYKRFSAFDHMLIYQSDAYVFSDELNYWVQQDYDFIGAPFHTDNSQPFDENIWTVGNGGFSLRSVHGCMRLIKKIDAWNMVARILNKLMLKRLVIKAMMKIGIYQLFYADGIYRNRYNEDYVFGVLSKKILKRFKVAPVRKAIQFSFEAHPSLLYKMNGNKLPFGCHGWSKYEPEFWNQFINTYSETVR